MSLNQISFKAMRGHSSKYEDPWGFCIKLVACNITNYLLAFKLKRLDCWCGKITLLEKAGPS